MRITLAGTSIRASVIYMFGFFRLTFLFLLLAPMPASAQQNSDPFCEKAPLEMLAALEGEWTLRQGAGMAAAGGMVIPLPPHPPKPVVFEFDEWFARLTAEDGNMLMFPTDGEQISASINYLTEAEAERLLDIGKGCDWYSLPIMAGTNSYSLDRAEGPPESIAAVFLRPKDEEPYRLCVAMPLDSIGLNDRNAKTIGMGKDSKVGIVMQKADGDKDCGPDHKPFELKSGEGQMIMNILIKFQSPNSGTGIVIFEGQMNGRKFGAKAPVKITR